MPRPAKPGDAVAPPVKSPPPAAVIPVPAVPAVEPPAVESPVPDFDFPDSAEGGSPPSPSSEGVHDAAPDCVPSVVTSTEGHRGSPPVCGAVSPDVINQTGSEAAGVRVADTVIPPEPAKGPYGDKTPEYMRWLHKYHPDEFRVRFRDSGGTLVRELFASLPVVS